MVHYHNLCVYLHLEIKLFQFEPVNDGDQPFAKQATEYVNWVFNKDNDGFLVLHNWFKDALLQKVGIVKAYWEDKIDVKKESYKGLTDDELAIIMQDPEVEIVEQETTIVQEAVFDEMTGMEVLPAIITHDVKFKKTTNNGKVDCRECTSRRVFNF
jgi:hypothetical protein